MSREGSQERSARQSFLRGELSEGPPWVGQAPQPGGNGVREQGLGRARESNGSHLICPQEVQAGDRQARSSQPIPQRLMPPA